jgi:hypothetical protein
MGGAMRNKLASLYATAIFLSLAGPASAQLAVAIVEDVKGSPAGVEFMDYVSAGQVIKLGPKDSVVIGYMKSCWRETITGGTVIVGAEQSEVLAGKVDRTRIACDPSFKQLTEQQQGSVGATVFRSLESDPKAPATQPAPVPAIHGVVVYGTSPVIEMKVDGKLVIERIDVPGERHVVFVGRTALVQGFYDLAKVRRTLTPGGIYVAQVGDRQTHFKVDNNAKAQTAIVGRLVRFQ